MASIETNDLKGGKKSYTVHWRDARRKPREKTFRRKALAKQFRARVEAARYDGVDLIPTRTNSTFGDTAATWQSTRGRKARSTQDRDQSYLSSLILPTFGEMVITSITPADIEVWLGSVECAGSTRVKAFHILRAVFEFARRKKLIPSNPARDVDPPASARVTRTRVALTDKQLRDVLEAAEIIDERTALLVHLMARCGLRSGEAIALQRRDVDLAAGTIAVTKSMSRSEGLRPVKGMEVIGEGRTIPMPTDVQDRIERHLREAPIANIHGYLVSSPRGGPISYTNWRSRVWSRIRVRANLDIVTHDLRRTAITRLFLEDGWTPAEVQRFAGHSDPRMTLDVYTVVSDKQLRQPTSLVVESA